MPTRLAKKKLWHDSTGNKYSDKKIKEMIVEYANNGGTVYVGADSMMNSDSCSFAAVIALHNREPKIARYFVKKINSRESKYKDIQIKIFEEVSLALQTAQFVLEVCPVANIEIHVDISAKKTNKTSRFYSMVKGWVSGMGLPLKVKPESWASSSIADLHTK